MGARRTALKRLTLAPNQIQREILLKIASLNEKGMEKKPMKPMSRFLLLGQHMTKESFYCVLKLDIWGQSSYKSCKKMLQTRRP